MIALPLGLFGKLFAALSRSREWLVFLAVAGAAAFLYVRYETAAKDRDWLATWAETACAAAGVGFTDLEVDSLREQPPQKRARAKRGALCRARIADLSKFERESSQASAAALADAADVRAEKSTRDAAAANDAAERAAKAATRMENADAQVLDDRVDRSWFDAVNDLGGLRRPPGS